MNKLTFKIILAMGFLNLFGCSNKTDLSKVYPYIITRDYLTTSNIDETIIVDTLIENELFMTVVKDLNGVVENIILSELKSEGISRQQIIDSAQSNLDKLFQEQKVTVSQFEGPNGLPFILFTDHWLSAASIYWTHLYRLGREHLKIDSIYVSIPQRDAMIIFPKCSNSELRDFKQLIKEKESDVRKPLTWEIFELDENGIKRAE